VAKISQKPSTVLYPVPAVLVSCGTGQEANIITLAWVGTLCSEPPLVGIGVRPGRHSHGLIKEVGEFVVNLPDATQTRWVDYCGMVSGRKVDKWAACGFTPAPASEVQVMINTTHWSRVCGLSSTRYLACATSTERLCHISPTTLLSAMMWAC